MASEGRPAIQLWKDRAGCGCELNVMGFYQDQIVPLLTNMSMRHKNLAAYRKRVVPEATGHVLEVGIGSGLATACPTMR